MKKPARSFKGWELKKWFFGNWKTIKELIKVGIPALVSFYSIRNPILAGFLTILGKFLIDSGEYFFKKKN